MSAAVSDRPMSEPAQDVDAPPRFWRGGDYIAESFNGADDALAALDAVQGGLISTGFQTLDWLIVLFEELAAAQGVAPRLVVVTERRSGAVALALPLLIEKSRYLRIARFADLGVSDYVRRSSDLRRRPTRSPCGRLGAPRGQPFATSI